MNPRGAEQAQPQATEPCVVCGNETAEGSDLNATRRRFERPDGRDLFLCAVCRNAAARGGEPLSEDELRDFVWRASLGATVWSSSG